ncbi:hypothetical protein BGZ99_001058 [Dissophora globulifera]|uniref:Ketoreductase domain-containing protein n=1 Tax=Dissophora globulifera TaxID=979702 RepID=A0A9P6R480_9FUNG|nr:hypothetical protein BGZ99_001058 [Dissophora globulifera]
MTSHRPTLIITGASRGIGRSTTIIAIQKLGANVVGVARSKESLEKLSQHIEGELNLKDRFKFVVGDVTAESTSQEAVALALKSWSGKLDGLVLNAGALEPIGKIATVPVEEWKKVFDVNVYASLITLQHALPALRESKGRIVILSSGASFIPIHGWSAYCASKAALKMFTDILALEEPELTTMSIRPGVADTDMAGITREKGAEHMLPEQFAMFSAEQTEKSLPVVHPDEPGHVVASLAISAAASLNGKDLDYYDDELKTHRM